MNKTITVTVKNPEHCIELQKHGWSIGCGNARAFAWKLLHEVTENDQRLFLGKKIAN